MSRKEHRIQKLYTNITELYNSTYGIRYSKYSGITHCAAAKVRGRERYAKPISEIDRRDDATADPTTRQILQRKTSPEHLEASSARSSTFLLWTANVMLLLFIISPCELLNLRNERLDMISSSHRYNGIDSRLLRSVPLCFGSF